MNCSTHVQVGLLAFQVEVAGVLYQHSGIVVLGDLYPSFYSLAIIKTSQHPNNGCGGCGFTFVLVLVFV
jgi:hypothetical protein